MSITVRVSDLLRKFVNGQETVAVAGHSPIECLHNLEAQFPDIQKWTRDQQGDLLPQIQFYVNGGRIHSDELTEPLNDGDEVFIVMAVAGG